MELEKEIHTLTQNLGIGAQFGGKYFCHDVRVVRLPRHGASCPVGIGVSCSADRQVRVTQKLMCCLVLDFIEEYSLEGLGTGLACECTIEYFFSSFFHFYFY